MTNKLEEVLKELQEKHVLVDREEYERLLEKAKEAESEEVKFKVDQYYAFEDAIFKIKELGKSHQITSLYQQDTGRMRTSFSVHANSVIAEKARKATDEEIKLFKRAEMYRKHGRKLGELKVGDLVKTNYSGFQFALKSTLDVELWSQTGTKSANNVEIYLTVEEQQEAYKKIVGE